MKKIGKKKLHDCIGFFVFTALLCLVSLWQFSTCKEELPGIVEWYAKDGYPYSCAQLQRLAENAQIGFYVQARQMVKEEILGSAEEMTVRWADAEYFEWSGFGLEAGQWPKEAEEAAVSYSWALEHYKSLNVVGQDIQVGDGKYRVSGVYTTENSWRRQLAGDGAQVLYLCFVPKGLPEGYDMNYLYFKKEGSDFQCNQQYLEDMAALATGTRVAPDISLDVEGVSHVCRQNLALCGILWLLSAAVFFGRFGKKIAGRLFFALCAACVIFYRWYIPMPYLPKENIFDFSWYIQRYIQGQNDRHLYQESGYFGNLAYIHIWLSWGLLILEILAAAYGMIKWKSGTRYVSDGSR